MLKLHVCVVYVIVVMIIVLAEDVPIKIRRSVVDASGISWCPQPLLPLYNRHAVRNCQPKLLISSSTDYKEFELNVCTVLTNHSMFVRFPNVNRYFFRGPISRVSEYMNGAYMLLKWALIHLSYPSDMFLEFGVAGGFSVNITADLRGLRHPRAVQAKESKIWGFDWFRGLPENWSDGPQRIRVGAFTQHGQLPKVAPSVQLIPGLFNETLEPFLLTHVLDKIAFVNIDMDLYSGAVYVLEKLLPHLQLGSIIHFHELVWTTRGGPRCRGADELRALWDVMRAAPPGLQLELLPLHQRDCAAALFVVTALPKPELNPKLAI